MTGPEHYNDAEQHLAWAGHNETGSDQERYNLAAAQVHATLALAAATAMQPSTHSASSPTYQAWREVAGEQS